MIQSLLLSLALVCATPAWANGRPELVPDAKTGVMLPKDWKQTKTKAMLKLHEPQSLAELSIINLAESNQSLTSLALDLLLERLQSPISVFHQRNEDGVHIDFWSERPQASIQDPRAVVFLYRERPTVLLMMETTRKNYGAISGASLLREVANSLPQVKAAKAQPSKTPIEQTSASSKWSHLQSVLQSNAKLKITPKDFRALTDEERQLLLSHLNLGKVLHASACEEDADVIFKLDKGHLSCLQTMYALKNRPKTKEYAEMERLESRSQLAEEAQP